MRPQTLAEAVDCIHAGAPQDATLAEFLDTFDLAATIDARYLTIEDGPALTQNERLDALVGAVAEYLAKQRRLGRVPFWVCDPARRLAEPWFTAACPTDGMREYLTYASPAAFSSRNIYTEEQPLRRARGPYPVKV